MAGGQGGSNGGAGGTGQTANGIGTNGGDGQPGFLGGGGGGGGAGGGLGGAGGATQQPNGGTPGGGGTRGANGTAGVPGSTGGVGDPGSAAVGAGGGGGGGHGALLTTLSSTATTYNGGAGGAGGSTGIGGGGGEGGYGVVVTGQFTTNTNNNAITGGVGGNGGNGAATNVDGAAGSGGIGLYFSQGSTGLVNNATITGGAGGTSRGNLNSAGGAGVVGSGLIITNNGTISGGLDGTGATRADAITFTSGFGTNGLTPGAGTLIGGIGITGALGISGPGNLSNVIHDYTGGSGSISKGSTVGGVAGTLTLSGVNTYTGFTSVNTGTLAISGPGSIANSSGVSVLSGATLDIVAASSNVNIRSLTGTGTGTINLGANNLTLTNAGNSFFAGNATGSGGLTISNGSLILTGTNDYIGATTINLGAVLNLGNAGTGGSLAPSSAIIDNGQLYVNHTDTIVLANNITGTGLFGQVGTGTTILTGTNTYLQSTFINSGTLQIGDGGTSGSVSASFSINGATATLAINHSDSYAITRQISGAGNFSQIGQGNTTLSANNTYTGTTTISSGTLSLSGTSSIAASSGVVDNGTFDISGVTAAGGTAIKTLSGSANGTLALGTQTLALTAAAGTFSGAITGTTGTLTLAVGAEVFSGHSTAFTGGVSFNAGTISLTQLDALDRAVVTFGTGAQTLNLDAVGTYTNTLTGFAVEDTIDLRGLASTGASASYDANSHNLTVSSGGQTDILHFATGYALPSGSQFTVSDDGAGHAKITLGLTPAQPTSSGPTATPDTGSTTIGAAVMKAAAMGVLSNDSVTGGTLTVTAVNGQTSNVGNALAGAYGNLRLNADGSYSYTPNAAKAVFTGSVVDHFTYTDTANGQTATTTLDITVTPPSASTLAQFGTVEINPASAAGSVYALYKALLGHTPDALGLENFAGSIQNGATPANVADAILASPEYAAKNPSPLSDSAYVSSLYGNLLNRAPDAQGQTYYQGELNAGVSRATVASQVATSQEAQSVQQPTFANGVFVADATDAQVARLYYGALGRTPDANGLASFEAQAKGLGLAGISQTMLSSQEFSNTHGNLGDAAFVDSLYVGALGRHAETGGSAYWTDQIAHGASRVQVAVQISESMEAQVHLVGQIENGFHLIG